MLLIFDTPTFNNEIVSFEIVIVPIENNFGSISKPNLLLHLLALLTSHNKQVLGAF